MTYLWILEASFLIFLFIGITRTFSFNRMVKKARDKKLVVKVIKRWRNMTILTITFVLIYFSLRIYQFRNGLLDPIYIIPDMIILITMIATALVSRKNSRIIKYIVEVR